MGHPDIENETPFEFAPIFMSNQEGRPFVLLLTKATYHIVNNASLVLADEQDPVSYAGEPWGEPGKSSYRYEPEVSWPKPATDVVLIASAWAQSSKTATTDVGFRVGPLTKTARVFGDRAWFKALGSCKMTPPRTFEKVPLTYERAFGGVDSSCKDPQRPAFEQRNPVGRGYRAKGSPYEDGILLPNVEDPKRLIRSLKDHPEPVGFGFTSPHWLPRATFAGTYDDAWTEQRAPLLPKDFDRRFWNAASLGLTAPGHLRGDEPVTGVNITKSGRLGFKLPGAPAPHYEVALANGGEDVVVEGRLDTVIVNTDDSKVHLLWRHEAVLRDGPHDVAAMRITADVPGARANKGAGVDVSKAASRSRIAAAAG